MRWCEDAGLDDGDNVDATDARSFVASVYGPCSDTLAAEGLGPIEPGGLADR